MFIVYCKKIAGTDDTADQETLLLTIEALKSQLEQQASLCKLQVSTCFWCDVLKTVAYKMWGSEW